MRSKSSLLLAFSVLAAGLAGCKTCGLVEAELRYQTRKVEELRATVSQRDAEIATLKATHCCNTCDGCAGTTIPPETIAKTVGVGSVSLGTLTGARDLNRDGADDALQIVIACHDADGDIIKCPGRAEVTLFETMPNGERRQIGSWPIDEANLRGSWRSTLLSQGYQLVLPWQTPPTAKNALAKVTFTTVDGRRFCTEKELFFSPSATASAACPAGIATFPPVTNIRPTPTARRKPLPVITGVAAAPEGRDIPPPPRQTNVEEMIGATVRAKLAERWAERSGAIDEQQPARVASVPRQPIADPTPAAFLLAPIPTVKR